MPLWLGIFESLPSLIDGEAMQWKKEMISDIFLPLRDEEICKIPLSLNKAPDRPVWHYSSDGHFSVKTAYPLAVHLGFILPSVGPIKWKPPPEGSFRVNVDGSWLQEVMRGCVGGVIRDCNGEVMGALQNIWVPARQLNMLKLWPCFMASYLLRI
ncbi:hypothetical protein F0562_010879 [Nyssa sinensis]|uniref:RNase H type-1 domain-containing protein n=1 Tax=Nyssa sinensis TaxID=561372 RepID=A0A5J5A305_9ASTE|nr:hypothetical protein F0562_010879 [Nyssa sinensis]